MKAEYVRLVCEWIPSTMDRVRIWIESAQQQRVVDIDWIRQHTSSQTLEDLYLKGRAFFNCELEAWRAQFGEPVRRLQPVRISSQQERKL